jgi:hypothetical protein
LQTRRLPLQNGVQWTELMPEFYFLDAGLRRYDNCKPVVFRCRVGAFE